MDDFGTTDPGEKALGMDAASWADSHTVDPDGCFVREGDFCDSDEEVGWVPAQPDAVALVLEVATMEAVFAAQRLARIDQLRLEALDDVTRYGGGSRELIERSVRLELAAALRITENQAAMLMYRAEALVHRYPTIWNSLAHAGMTERHATIIVDELAPLEPQVAARLVEKVRELAETLAIGPFRRALRRLIDRELAPTLSVQHEHAVRRRRIFVEPEADGMSWLHALLPSVEAHAIHGRITAQGKALLAAQVGGEGGGSQPDDRTLDEIRTDILCDLLIDGIVPAHPKDVQGIRPTVVVTVPALALLGADGDGAHEPAVVEGVGPIPIEKARELAGAATGWIRVLTHPETGVVLSVGRTRYRPPPDMVALTKWRADRCMAPGCGVPASRCQIDHSLAWEDGGETSVVNTAPLCQGHHTIKHHGGWRVIQTGDGSLLWISPSGRQYVVAPERRLPVFREDSVAA
ncbi:HNH endonuclease signature motif containing protein [Microbacterium schleiferi]|uniref:HNH endonuclease signature motif containing protein n=1 Tax=Microbacterium schleiferi TaxID=69362 RepID=UPI00311E8364